jgi:hypothetical protein
MNTFARQRPMRELPVTADAAVANRRLLHYSQNALTQRLNSAQNQEDYFKPQGFWVSVEGEDDWRSWCQSEGYGHKRYFWQTAVALTGVGKPILRIDGRSIDDFTDNYVRENLRMEYYAIDWPRVAQDYSGIIIAPYSWHHRRNDRTQWYYGWDCASGCLWNAEAWTIVSPSEPVVFTKPEG